MPHAGTFPWRALPAALLLAATSACRSAPPAPELEALRAGATPTLEEIFLVPGIQGRPPRISELSADGRWLAFRFNPLERSEGGVRSISDERALRLQSTVDPAAFGLEGRRVDELLPERAPEPEGEKPRRAGSIDLAFSHRGARMLALRGKELFLLDPPADPRAAWTVRTLLVAQADTPLAEISSPRFTADDAALLVHAKSDAKASQELWRFPLEADDSRPWPLAAEHGVNLTHATLLDAGSVTFSRNLQVAFSGEKPVAKVEVPATDAEPAATRDAQILWCESGKAVELAGSVDWSGVSSTALSPDGRFLLAVADKSPEPGPTLIPDYLSERVSTRPARANWAENGPFPRKLHLWNTATGERTELALGDSEHYWLRLIGWAPQPSAQAPLQLALARTSADFRTRETFVWTEAGGLVKVLEDRDPRWLGGQVDRARWTNDGRRLVFGSESYPESTTPGRSQLFDLELATGKVRQLTNVSGEVSSFDVARGGSVAFSYSEGHELHRCKLAWITPEGEVRETAAPVGCNMDPQVAGDGSRAVFMHSELFRPTEIWSIGLAEVEPAQPLTHGAPEDFIARDWIKPVRLEVASADGARVFSHVFLPLTTTLERPDRARGCVVFIHGAGYLQNVTDSMTEYEPNLLFHARLAGMGYVVVDVDYRGSAGYGGDFRTGVQSKLGELELADIRATLDDLGRRGVIDRDRCACYGGSYGGFLTLMALFTEGERWRAGAALRSVTDWRTYSPEYTQPRQGKPSTHAEAYARSSPIDHAEGLSKPLLLLHGMMDSNVFAQDTIRLMEKLIDLGKDFDVMLYPSQNHAFTDGAHWLDEYKRIEKFLMQHLGAP